MLFAVEQKKQDNAPFDVVLANAAVKPHNGTLASPGGRAKGSGYGIFGMMFGLAQTLEAKIEVVSLKFDKVCKERVEEECKMAADRESWTIFLQPLSRS